jgi:hypothetical protein
LASYKLTYDKGIADELRKRFASEIAFLENEGFSSFSVHQELIYPFSLFTFFPVYLAMRAGNEIVQIESPFRITSFHIILTMSHSKKSTRILGCWADVRPPNTPKFGLLLNNLVNVTLSNYV